MQEANITKSNSIGSNSNSGNVDYLKNGNLLKNIKSIFFSRILFSYLDEKIKLKVIKYNKKLQNKMDIKLINYKFYHRKYIIYETNIKGKEYLGCTDDLLFEGEYLNGERNGKGKEYDCNGKLIFEGEYLNGKRNGKGKEYYSNGKLRFEGEYLNDERLTGKLYDTVGNLCCNWRIANELIKEYNFYGKLEFEGEYLNGKVKEYYTDYNIYYPIRNILKFEGEYLNGKRNGKGKEYYFYRKIKFEGEYINGKRNGKGKEYYPNGKIKFEGIYINGNRYKGIGYDILYNKIYELKNGEGYVKEYIGYKIIIEGEYLNFCINGKGKEYYLGGKFDGKLKFEGEYLYTQKLRGKYYIDGKLEYEGEYLYNKKWNGKGYDENGNIVYELKNGNGFVKEYNDDGVLEFEGEYLNGKRNGKGKEYNDGVLEFEGEYLNGKRI